MKGFLRSKLVLSLVALLTIAFAIVVPLTGSILRTHAQATASDLATVPTPIPALAPEPTWGLPFPMGTQVSVTQGPHDHNYMRVKDETTGNLFTFGNTATSINASLDIAPTDTTAPVIPLANGVVLAIEPKCHRMLIDYGGGWWAIYLHLAKFQVKAGDFVNVRTTVAFVNTNEPAACGEITTGPHVHVALANGSLTPTGGTAEYVDIEGRVLCGHTVNSTGPDGLTNPFQVPQCPRAPGNLWVTGHDTDFHCSTAISSPGPSCHYLKVAVNLLLNGSFKPGQPILVLDHGTEVATALKNAFPFKHVPIVVVDPRSTEFTSLVLVSPKGNPVYSMIIIASDTTCGGCDNNNGPGDAPDSDAIDARAAAIAAYHTAGGSILALAGAQNISIYYQFLPIPVAPTAVTPVSGQPGRFGLTVLGKQELGLVGANGPNSDINCCITHNSFFLPSPSSPFEVAEIDAAANAETLISLGR